MSSLPPSAAGLFRHVGAERGPRYRAVLDVFAAAKRQYRLQLRPDEVLAEAEWAGAPPSADELAALLAQLVDWGNLEAQPDIARVATLADYYRARFIYRLSAGGEAVESALVHFADLLARRAELQTVALEDIALRKLAERYPDRPLLTNVEYYTAAVLQGVGLPPDLFPSTFALARHAGWTAHALEQVAVDRLIRPDVRYIGPAERHLPGYVSSAS